MNFNSLSYLIFLPVTVILYFTLPGRLKNPMLLAASFYFYMCWEPVYALLMLASIAVTYWSGLLIEDRPERKKLWLALSFVINLGILFFFKYFNFAASLVYDAAAALGLGVRSVSLNVLLPVGISFYTFQALSYSADMYNGTVSAERSFITYALYVSFFPQLVAGPIERSDNIIPQLRETHRPSWQDLAYGGQYLLWGFFKKVVIADRLAVLVNAVYDAPQSFGAVQLWAAATAFAFQIYCDFSAYSDIAKGSARLIGVSLMVNFDSPFCSRTTQELWRRWHISLSSWFRDYLYIPLGGGRRGKWRKYLNVLAVTFASGLWHGAALTFVAWGVVNGLFQIFGDLTRKARRRVRELLRIPEEGWLYKGWQMLFVFVLFVLSFVFFRADSMGDALYVLGHMLSPAYIAETASLSIAGLGLGARELLAAGVSVAVLMGRDLISLRGSLEDRIAGGSAPVRYLSWLFLLGAILIFGAYGSGYDPQAFIYFQF